MALRPVAAPRLRRRHDATAREDMASPAFFSGLALANVGLGAVQDSRRPSVECFQRRTEQFARRSCSRDASESPRSRQRQPENAAFGGSTRLTNFTGSPTAQAEDAVEWIRNLCGGLGIPGLRAYGITVEHGRMSKNRQGQQHQE